MNSINQNVVIASNNKLPHIVENGAQNYKAGSDLRIKKIALFTLAVLVGTLAIAGSLVIAAAFLPYAAFAAGAFTAFKVIAAITGIAAGTFALTQVLDYLAPKLPRPLAAVANSIHAAITEIFALITMSALYFVNLEKTNPKKVEHNNQQPILLIHGLVHNSSAWIEYRKRLKDANVGPVFTINLGNPFGSIDGHAEKVKGMVAEIQRITGRKDIMLVGHSMGGLVASKFALDLATEETRVTDIVTIGSPLKGTPLAKLIRFGKDIKEMGKGSAYVRDLSEKNLPAKKYQLFPYRFSYR